MLLLLRAQLRLSLLLLLLLLGPGHSVHRHGAHRGLAGHCWHKAA